MGNHRLSDRPGPDQEAENPPTGVRSLDHTADVGLEVEAATLPELFRRAGHGALWVALGRRFEGNSDSRSVSIQAGDLAGLLRSWLREVLLLQEVEGFAVSAIHLEGPIRIENDNPEDTGWTLRAELEGGTAPASPLREVKGVTWHGLVVDEHDGRWRARVIFDV